MDSIYNRSVLISRDAGVGGRTSWQVGDTFAMSAFPRYLVINREI